MSDPNHNQADPARMTAEEKAERREAVIQGMIAKGHTRERAEEIVGHITKTLFGQGGRFAQGDRGEVSS